MTETASWSWSGVREDEVDTLATVPADYRMAGNRKKLSTRLEAAE